MSRVSTKSESAKKKKPARASAVSTWQNRIVSFDPAVDPEQLLAHPDNWRIHTLGQRAVLEGVLDSVGWVAPVIVNVQTSHTLDGHQRIESAITKGDKVPVMYVDVTEAEEKAILATFDPIGALAVRDAEKHDALLAEMALTHTSLTHLLHDAQALSDAGGYPGHESDGSALKEGNTDPDAVPVERPTTIVRGDMFQLGPHRLLCGDSVTAESFEVDALISDPPYGIDVVKVNGKIGGDKPFGSTTNKGTVGVSRMAKAGVYLAVHGDDVPFDPSHLFNLAPKVIVWGANYFPRSLPSRGQWLVWDKDRPEGTTFSDCELAWMNGDGVAVKKKKITWNGMIREGEHDPRVHPTQKPIALMEWCVEIATKEGERVLDPYAGSGTTLIACERLNRSCVAIEYEPSYCQVIIDRWEAFTGQQAVKLEQSAAAAAVR